MDCTSYSYGPDSSQYGQLYLPAQRTHDAVVVIIHGGYWRSRYGLDLGEPAARDLASRGYVCWNLEYRRAGNGGGWPETFDDVAAGIDLLAELGGRLELPVENVVVLGHSAGGHLAAWAGGRASLPAGVPGADPAVGISTVLSQAGVLDLRRAWELGLSDQAVENFLGCGPDDEPQRFRWADPLQQVPLAVPVYAFHSDADDAVPVALSENYVAAAQAAGGRAELVRVPGDHFDIIDPASAAFGQIRTVLESLG